MKIYAKLNVTILKKYIYWYYNYTESWYIWAILRVCLSQHIKSFIRSLVCPVGFLGAKCEKPCIYPGYGSGCQMKCNCTEEFCDPVNGCNDVTIERKIHVTYSNPLLETILS